MPIYFQARKKFDHADGTRWTDYIQWSGLTQLREAVTLDAHLCRHLDFELNDEDWKHNVHEDEMLDFFHSVDYVMQRVRGLDRILILGAAKDPTAEVVGAMTDPRFEFCGFDLLNVGISSLLNCGGGFDKAFHPTELSSVGLISDLTRAVEVHQKLREAYPDEPHADCDLWALWRMIDQPTSSTTVA